MKITKRQLKRIIKEELLSETAPTFGLRNGDSVRHKDEPERGLGKVVAKGSSRDRVILVKWEDGYTQRHDPSSLVKEGSTKRQLRKIIREALTGPPQTAEEWMYWGGEFGLSAEEDNDGQTIFYLSSAHPDRARVAAEALKAGASVDTDNDGNDVIYTGMTDMGPMYADEDHTAAEEILSTRMGNYSGTTLPGGKRIK